MEIFARERAIIRYNEHYSDFATFIIHQDAAIFPVDYTDYKYTENSVEKLVLLTLMSVSSLSDKSSRNFNFNFTGACEQIIKNFQPASKHTYREAMIN